MGGGGEKRAQKGLGGLGTGCDASSVPLEEVIHCSFPDLSKFISILLDHKASASPQKGRKDPLDVAIKLQKFDVVNMLMDRCNKAGASVKTSSSKPHKVGILCGILLWIHSISTGILFCNLTPVTLN